MSFYKYFFEKVKALNPENPGSQFVAITDPGTSLEQLAKVSGFRKVFLASPDVGGRFSALTYFGMVPASLIGADIAKLLDHAHAMMQKTATNLTYTQNEAVDLGVAMAVLSEEGRDKLT